jgi:hypothetical protein
LLLVVAFGVPTGKNRLAVVRVHHWFGIG